MRTPLPIFPWSVALQAWADGFRTAIVLFGHVWGDHIHDAMPLMFSERQEAFTYDELSVGSYRELTTSVTKVDTVRFGLATKDTNRVHFDERYMEGTPYGKTIAHGMRCGSFISALLARFPGPGTVYVSQNCHFVGPVFHGDIVTVRVEVIAKKEWGGSDGRKRQRIALRTTVRNQRDEEVVRGRAIIIPPQAKGH